MLVINIEEQNAENIYNVHGDVHFEYSKEVVEHLKEQKQKELRSVTSISFLEILVKEFSTKKLIERPELMKDLDKILEFSNQVLIFGEPGIGKTTFLFQLLKSKPEVLYISVRDVSPISIVSYLINKIRAKNNQDLLEVENLNYAIDLLRAELQNAEQYFIIDDCEKIECSPIN